MSHKPNDNSGGVPLVGRLASPGISVSADCSVDIGTAASGGKILYRHSVLIYRAIHEGRIDQLTQNNANVAAFIPIGLLLGCALGKVKWC